MTATSFDYVNDDKLAGLPLALRQRMVATQQARIDAGFTASNGVTYRTMEKKVFIDDLIAWQNAGKSAKGKKALQAREADLREKGLF